MRFFHPILVLLVGGWVAPVLAQEDVPVELRFAWPEQARATVRENRAKGERTIESAYRLEVSRGAEGTRILRRRDFRILAIDGIPADRPELGRDRAAQELEGFQPAIEVDANGQFVRILDYEKVVDAAVAHLAANGHPDAEGFGRLISSLEYRAQIEQKRRWEWEALAGSWIGLSLRVGESKSARVTQEIPLLGPTVQLEGRGETRCVARSHQAEQDRVHLAREIVVDDPALAGALKEIASRFGGEPIPEEALAGVVYRSRVEGTFEVSTLQPYEVHRTQRLEGRLAGRDTLFLDEATDLEFDWNPD